MAKWVKSLSAMKEIWGRSSGEGNGNPLQNSCLENPMDRGAWQATVHRVAESDMTEETEISTTDVYHMA